MIVTGEVMMSGYTIQATCELPFEDTVAAVRAELTKAGFGVITEIDLRATLRQKIGAEIPAEVILGACNPRFAHRAISIDPSVAALLPCNVVVRSLGDRSTLVEAFDPGAMMQLAGGHGDMEGLAAEVAQQLRAALASVPGARRSPVTG
jgi:uncharacterized protein (DUF302 family)